MRTSRATSKSSTAHTKALMEELERFLEERDQTQASVARAIGISASALNQWLSGKYKGDVKGLEHAINGYLHRQKERARTKKTSTTFVMTTAAAKVFEAAKMCHMDGDIGVVVGDAGTGKTTSVKEYASRNSDVILIEADLGYTARDLFSELHRKCGFDGQGSIHRMKDEVINKLCDSGRLIVIDEAEHLPVRALDLVRRINDKAGVGILFCGLKRFMENLRLKQADFAYLYTRVGFKVTLDKLQPSDVESVVEDAIPESNDLWKTFYEESHGNCRVLRKLVVRAVRLAEVNGVAVTSDIIREAAKMLAV